MCIVKMPPIDFSIRSTNTPNADAYRDRDFDSTMNMAPKPFAAMRAEHDAEVERIMSRKIDPNAPGYQMLVHQRNKAIMAEYRRSQRTVDHELMWRLGLRAAKLEAEQEEAVAEAKKHKPNPKPATGYAVTSIKSRRRKAA